MPDEVRRALREDCRASLSPLPRLPAALADQRIAVVGGTGFVGSWLAEAVAALNDDFGARVRLDLYGRSVSRWHVGREHLCRADITLHALDVRAPFELRRDTTLVLFAAGIADPRVQASDPHRVFQTSVYGVDHALSAASRLEDIRRFVHLSSGLVLGGTLPQRALGERDLGLLDFTQLHMVYAEARRAAESLACACASQYRLPLSTARAFTFFGPYQPLDAPWALNNFIRDALAGHEIRIHGDGSTRRSYLYGSDVAAWLLQALVAGRDSEIYNIGGCQAVSHAEAASLVSERIVPAAELLYRSQPHAVGRNHDFLPDVSHSMQALGVAPVFDLQAAIERTMRWHAHHLGSMRRLRVAA